MNQPVILTAKPEDQTHVFPLEVVVSKQTLTQNWIAIFPQVDPTPWGISPDRDQAVHEAEESLMRLLDRIPVGGKLKLLRGESQHNDARYILTRWVVLNGREVEWIAPPLHGGRIADSGSYDEKPID